MRRDLDSFLDYWDPKGQDLETYFVILFFLILGMCELNVCTSIDLRFYTVHTFQKYQLDKGCWNSSHFFTENAKIFNKAVKDSMVEL